jgi:Outer membrane lipoprotein carrier protein LolA-like
MMALLSAVISSQIMAAPTSEALLARLVRPAPATTRFVEVRFSDLLIEPLISRGELSFDAADQLGKHVDAPFQETTQVRGESVRIERKGQKPMQFNLKRAPELRALLAGFSGLLSGNLSALQQHFKVSIEGTDARWQIRLDPIAARMRKRISGVSVLGADNAPRCFRIEEADGDASIMLVDAAATEALPDPLTLPALIERCRGKAH